MGLEWFHCYLDSLLQEAGRGEVWFPLSEFKMLTNLSERSGFHFTFQQHLSVQTKKGFVLQSCHSKGQVPLMLACTSERGGTRGALL